MSLHAGFAASAVIGEKLVNDCLATYLATYGDTWRRNVAQRLPRTINGVPQYLELDVEFSIVSLQAALRDNPHGLVELTIQFYGVGTFSAWEQTSAAQILVVDPAPLLNFEAEVVLTTTVAVPMIALTVGDHFQLGLDLSAVTLHALNLNVLQPPLPSGYQQGLNDILAEPKVKNELQRLLRSILPSQLRVTTAMIPAYWDMTMQKPLHPEQQWFSTRIQASRLVFFVGDRHIRAGVDMLGYTHGNPALLRDYRNDVDPINVYVEVHDRREDQSHVAVSANLQALQDFLRQAVFPQMTNQWLEGRLFLHRVVDFKFDLIGTMLGNRFGLEIKLDVTYFTDEFVLFILNDTSAVRAQATIRGYPYMKQGRVYFEVTHVDIELPTWLSVLKIVLSSVLPPLTLIVPGIFQNLLHNAQADIINQNNNKAVSNALILDRELLLPETPGPMFHLIPQEFRFIYAPGNNNMQCTVFAQLEPVWRYGFSLSCVVEGENIVNITGARIRKYGMLPAYINVTLKTGISQYQPNDPTLHVRWEVFLNEKPVVSLTRDLLLRDPKSRELRVIPVLFTKPNKSDQEIKITCRVYRTFATATQENLNQTIIVESVDPRPEALKPYVRWTHWVKYWNGFKFQNIQRISKIHKKPGRGGCKFSNQYERFTTPSPKYRVYHLSHLPFDMEEINQNLDLVCPYCFFGGPDKGYHPWYVKAIDITSKFISK
jgi:hypothetical protein